MRMLRNVRIPNEPLNSTLLTAVRAVGDRQATARVRCYN
jgi:hypothetical protein